jgi:hypothetical protein
MSQDEDLLALVHIKDPAVLMPRLIEASAEYFAERISMTEFAEHRWRDLLVPFAENASGEYPRAEVIRAIKVMRDGGILSRDEMAQLLMLAQQGPE